MQTHHQLSEFQKQKRLSGEKVLLDMFKDGPSSQKIIFSDEKMFTVEAKINLQNDKILQKCSSDIDPSLKTIFRRQKP